MKSYDYKSHDFSVHERSLALFKKVRVDPLARDPLGTFLGISSPTNSKLFS